MVGPNASGYGKFELCRFCKSFGGQVAWVEAMERNVNLLRRRDKQDLTVW